MTSRIISFFVAFTFYISQVNAQIITPMNPNSGREFFVGTTLGQPLMTVNLVNGVTNPGVYRVPIETNMAELFSYAGGVLPESDLSNVVVRRKQPTGQYQVMTYDFSEAFSNPKEPLPKVSDQDVIQIQQGVSLDRSIKWMTIASMAASILAVIVIIDDRRN